MIPSPDDFYVENGKFVWTEKFLLNRGYCCKNNCRHCPFKDQKAQQSQEETKEKPSEAKKDVFWLLSK